MPLRVPRREFLAGMGAMAAASTLSCLPAQALLRPELLYPPVELTYFDKPISTGPAEIHIGYAAITWDGNDRQAIQDIAELGFRGIQLRSNCIREFGSPAILRDLLQKYALTMVALSSGDLGLDRLKSKEIARHTANAKFVRDVGGFYLQIIDQSPHDRRITTTEYKPLGRLLTEIGKRTADLGVSLAYHNHMGSLSERPEGLDRIMQAADPRYVKLVLDVAHYFQGGGDPVGAITKYRERLLFLHIKDVAQLPGARDAKPSYRFVELGRGQVELPAIFRALYKVNFRGWVVVELDTVSDPNRTPKESAVINKKYLQERLGLTV